MKNISNPTALDLIMLLWKDGPQQRLELSKALGGVQPSTVTRVANQLLDDDYIAEMSDPIKGGRRGFPSKQLYLKPGKLLSAGIFVDPERIYSCVVDMLGGVMSEASKPISDASLKLS